MTDQKNEETPTAAIDDVEAAPEAPAPVAEQQREPDAEAVAPEAEATPEVEAAAASEAGGDGQADAEEDDGADEREAIGALTKLSDRLFARMCRRLPMRTFIAELQRIDRSVYFRYFKGYRPVKIDARRVETVLRQECLAKGNGLLAQLVIYNWDEAEYRLYGSLQKHVKAINEDVEAIEHITDEQADPIVEALEADHDRRDVCIAMVINGVRVSDEFLAARYGDLL